MPCAGSCLNRTLAGGGGGGGTLRLHKYRKMFSSEKVSQLWVYRANKLAPKRPKNVVVKRNSNSKAL